METSFLAKTKITLFFMISYFLFIDAQLTFIRQACTEDSDTSSFSSNYRENVDNTIIELISRASTTYFSNYTAGVSPDQVNAIFSCRYDVSPSVCQSCVASVANNISSCRSSLESLIAYEECTFHYSNRSIFSIMEEFPLFYHVSLMDAESLFSFRLENIITALISNVTADFSASSRYFATTMSRYSSSESIYALAQCNPDITSSDCRTCLQTGYQFLRSNYTNTVYGQTFSPSCRLSYILSTEVLSRPWRFQKTAENMQRRFSFPSTGMFNWFC